MGDETQARTDLLADLGDVLLDELKAVRLRRLQFTAEAKTAAPKAEDIEKSVSLMPPI
jgi:hypothetical protein